MVSQALLANLVLLDRLGHPELPVLQALQDPQVLLDVLDTEVLLEPQDLQDLQDLWGLPELKVHLV